MKQIFSILLLAYFLSPAWGLVQLVAAENTYAQVAQRIGGQYVQVTPLMSKPNQDPHLFTAGTEQAKALAGADVVVFNGAGYDSWVESLLAGTQHPGRVLLVVANLVPDAAQNPHIWYDPQTLPRYARALTTILQKQDPQHAGYFAQRLRLFLTDYHHLETFLGQVKFRDHGKAVLVTEPLFEPMANALGIKVKGQEFARQIMNESSPTPANIADFEQALETRSVQVLIYNVQMVSPLIERMRAQAQANHIPCVGISETQPLKTDYIVWMQAQVAAVDEALNGSH